MKKSVAKATRRVHSDEFRAEALRLADQIGAAAAARQLGLHASQVYQWRAKAAHEASVTQRESDLAVENARLRRELVEEKQEVEISKKEADYYGAKENMN